MLLSAPLFLLAGSLAFCAASDDAREIIPVPKAGVDLDDRIEFVSVVIDADPIAAGLGWRPADSCENQELLKNARTSFQEHVSERREWLATRRARVDRLLDRELTHVRTPHFELSCDLNSIKVGRKTVKGLDVAILYATRLEDYYDGVATTLSIDADQIHRENRYEVFLLEEEKGAETIARELFGNKLGTGYVSTRVGFPIAGVLIWTHREYIENDEQRHQRLVHALAHLVYHDVGLYQQWMYDGYGWLYEGLAFYEEIRRFGPVLCSCEPKDALDLKHWLSPFWEANIRTALKQRRDPDPVRVLAPGVEELSYKDRQFAWSYVDFLIWYDAPKMAVLLEKVKGEKMTSEDALMASYGMDIATFQEKWRAFVIEHYKSKERKGPTPARAPRSEG